jgi:hypothetical protein
MKINKRSLIRVVTSIVLLGSCSFVWAKYNEFVIYNDIDNIGTMNEAEKAHFFENIYPTAEQISDYLRDATILFSYNRARSGAPARSYENEIIYLDTDRHYYEWRASGKNEFDSGSWSIHDRFMISNFRGTRKYQRVQVFCRHDKYLLPQYQTDNCRIADGLVRLLSRGYDQVYEYRKGNAFGISEGTELPFIIPRDSTASFESFLALYRSSTK